MTTSDNISAIEAIEAIEKAMERATPGEWVAGWGNGLTGPTTPISGGVVGGKEWGYEPVSNGYETIATCHNQIAVGEMFVEAKGTAKANSAYIAACNPVAMSAILAEARKANDELAVARSVHRWNVDRYGENLAVCRNEHEKGDPCEWETFVPLARAEAAEDRVAELETALDRAPDGRHFDILAEALAEVKATSDGKSDQSIADIVAGCLDEIAALPPRRARTLLNGGSDADN